MGFLQTLLFYRTIRRAGDDHHAPSSQTHSERSHPSQVDPLTPTTLEDDAHGALLDDLDLQLARRLVKHERISCETKSSSESKDSKQPIVREQNNDLERYTTATSEDRQTAQRPSTEPNTSAVSSTCTSRNGGLQQRTSGGFAALRTVLRHRRPLPKQSTPITTAETAKFVDGDVKSPVLSDADVREQPSKFPATCNKVLLMPTTHTKEDLRKVSDQTVQTEITETSRITVCRWPSRHVTTPITTVDPKDLQLPDVSEHQESAGTSISVEAQRPVLHSHPHRPPSSEYSDHPGFRDISRITQASETSCNISVDLANLSSDMLSQRLFSDMRSQSRQQGAIREFNDLAGSIKLEPLVLKESDASIGGWYLTTHVIYTADRLPR
jgi:hypothetical protein